MVMHQAAGHQKPDRPLLYKIAAAAVADPRTVARFLAGEPVRGLATIRIRDACAAMGVALPERAS